MTDLDLNEVAADVPIPRDEQLKQLSALAEAQLESEQTVENLELELKQAKERLRTIAEVKIPEKMNSLGITEFKLSNGLKVSVKPWFMGKITDDNQETAYAWLEQHGHGGIVKHDLAVQVRMSEDTKLEDIRKLAEKLGLDIKEKLGIHHMTFGAWIKEQVTEGKYIPRQLLGVTQGFRAKINK